MIGYGNYTFIKVNVFLFLTYEINSSRLTLKYYLKFVIDYLTSLPSNNIIIKVWSHKINDVLQLPAQKHDAAIYFICL